MPRSFRRRNRPLPFADLARRAGSARLRSPQWIRSDRGRGSPDGGEAGRTPRKNSRSAEPGSGHARIARSRAARINTALRSWTGSRRQDMADSVTGHDPELIWVDGFARLRPRPAIGRRAFDAGARGGPCLTPAGCAPDPSSDRSDERAARRRTAACVSTAWIIVFNKPFYPVYVWALIGRHAAAPRWRHCCSRRSTRRFPSSPEALRVGRAARPAAGRPLPTRSMRPRCSGADAGTELFLFPCALLAIVGFRAREAVASRVLTVAVYVAFVASARALRSAAPGMGAGRQARASSSSTPSPSASLTAFIGLRFASVE